MPGRGHAEKQLVKTKVTAKTNRITKKVRTSVVIVCDPFTTQ